MAAKWDPAEAERLIAGARAQADDFDRHGTGLGPVILRAMADQLEAARAIIEGLSPAAIQAVVDENDRLRAGFEEMIKNLQSGRPVKAGFCCWCGQHWFHLEGESFETLRKYTAEHAETCPCNSIRIERDAALAARAADLAEAAETYEAMRAEIARLREELGHATIAEGDWLSKTSRQMCETMIGDREALRDRARELTAELEALRCSDVDAYFHGELSPERRAAFEPIQVTRIADSPPREPSP